jgi:hypothetical protein
MMQCYVSLRTSDATANTKSGLYRKDEEQLENPKKGMNGYLKIKISKPMQTDSHYFDECKIAQLLLAALIPKNQRFALWGSAKHTYRKRLCKVPSKTSRKL